ncbi:DNA damage-inducible transcript 4 protein-like [Antennarius striatus]|uniref:DNA damage-inducible transcript 4 protein-like n=1 Tax=Antennarius striatus TaxID=241820 RepID=UPI0035B17C52
MSSSCTSSVGSSFCLSPAEDGSSKRLSWGSLMQRLTELKGINQRVPAEHHQCSFSEMGSVADMTLSESDCSCFFPLEETLAAEVTEIIALSLIDASDILGCSKVILPDCLLQNISQELLHLALSEPCGLRGALIDLCVDIGEQGSLSTVDQIAVDDTVVPTFQVTLVLRLGSIGVWPKFQKLFKVGKTYLTPVTTATQQNPRRLSPSFRAIKRKLYCSGELLIEECC